MQIVIGGKDKLKTIAELFGYILRYRVFDVGCRDQRLKNLINPRCQYYGMDINPIYQPYFLSNIEDSKWRCLKKAFDIVVALDVLEHIDNFCEGFQNICRATQKFVLISLPNLYYYKHRIKFLFGKTHSAKYGLPVCHNNLTIDFFKDRHRWLFTVPNAREFVRANCSSEFRIAQEICLAGPRFRYLKFLPKLWPNLFTQTYVVLLERR